MTMPRSLQEILEHADELGRRTAEHEPADVRDAAPLHAIREAVTERATERRVAEAVATAREAGERCGILARGGSQPVRVARPARAGAPYVAP